MPVVIMRCISSLACFPKWGRRNRLAVISAAFVLIVASIGLAIPKAAVPLFELELVCVWLLPALFSNCRSSMPSVMAIGMFALAVFGLASPHLSAAFFGGIIGFDVFAIMSAGMSD